MLKEGTKAPELSIPDQNGNIRTIGDFAGKKTLIFFYSKDGTSGCTKQAQAYSQLAEEFEKKGAAVIGISRDSVASHKKFGEKYGLKITLLSDTEKKVINAYDVWKEKKLYGKPTEGVLRTTYVIDENGVVIYANDKVKAAEDAGKMIGIV